MQTGTRPKIGVLLITTPRFRNLGEQTEQGVFHKRKEREAQGILTELRTFSEVVFTSIVYTREDLRTAMKAFETEDVDMVFACFLSWSDDFAWIRFLRDMKPIPILFASIVRNKLGFSNSMNEDRFVEFLSAGTLVGTLEASGSIRRFQRPMLKHIVGTLAQVIAVCKPFAQAALLRSQLSQMHWALLPSLNEVMWSTYVDPYTLFMQVGCELHFLTITELKQLIEQMSDSLVSETTRMLQARYRCDDTVDQVKLEASVRASLALESLCRKHQVEVLVLNDIHPNLLEEVGLRPGFTPCPGTDDVLVVPEGDIGEPWLSKY
jgi:L-arabinose isomerase